MASHAFCGWIHIIHCRLWSKRMFCECGTKYTHNNKYVTTVIGDLADTLLNSGGKSEIEIQNQIGFALDDLATGNDQILSARSGVGARINVMENANNSNADFQVVNKETRASIEDIDWATAITDLTKSETILEASRQIFSRVSGLSLFDYLR